MTETRYNQRVLLQSMPITISNGLNALYWYTQQTTELYDKWQNEQLLLLERRFKTDNKDNGEFLNIQVDQRIKLQSILFNSTFISCVAFFESQFRLICEILVTDQHRLVAAKGKSTIQRYYNFISKNLKVNLTAKDNLFDSLKLHYQIRNRIVHEQASIQGDLDLIKKIKAMKYITLLEPFEDYFEIEIRDCAFVYDYIEIVREYLNFVNEEVLKQFLTSEMYTPTIFDQAKKR